MHRTPQHGIHPGRNGAVFVQRAGVVQLHQGRPGANPGHLRAIGLPPGEHLVGDDAQREQVRLRRARLAQKVFGGCVLQGARNAIVGTGHRVFGQAGDVDRAKVNDLHGARGVDHDVFGPQVLVQHLHAVKGLQAACDLVHDVAHHRQFGPGVVNHPLGQCLALHVFHGHIQVLALAPRRGGLQHMGAVNAPRNPFFHQKTVEAGGVVLQVDRGRFEHRFLPAVGVDGQVDVAAVAAVQLAHDLVAVEHGAGFQHGRQLQRGPLALQFAGVLLGQRINAHDLNGQVVVAAAAQGFVHDGAGGLVQIGGVGFNGLRDEAGADMFMHAIGGQHKGVCGLYRQGPVIHLQLRLNAERAAQVDLLGRQAHPVVFGQLLQRLALHPVDAGVTHMKQVCGGGFDDQRAEGADITPVFVKTVGAALGLGVQPRVGGRQHALCRALDAPGLGGAVIVLQQPVHRSGAGDLADIAAADAIGQCHHHPLGGQCQPLWHAGAVKVLVDLLAALVRVLANAYFQGVAHWRAVRSGGRIQGCRLEVPCSKRQVHCRVGTWRFRRAIRRACVLGRS